MKFSTFLMTLLSIHDHEAINHTLRTTQDNKKPWNEKTWIVVMLSVSQSSSSDASLIASILLHLLSKVKPPIRISTNEHFNLLKRTTKDLCSFSQVLRMDDRAFATKSATALFAYIIVHLARPAVGKILVCCRPRTLNESKSLAIEVWGRLTLPPTAYTAIVLKE